MTKAAHFRVVTRMDRVRAETATITINRGHGLFSVRPYRRRRAFTLPLETVASMVVSTICRAEGLRRLHERRAKRKRRS
jgi:hypothetical protein